MGNDKIKRYNELSATEKEVMDTFRKMKLLRNHSRFRLHRYQIEYLINDYEKLKKLREHIQVKYFSIYEELLTENLVEEELDASSWRYYT